MRFTASCLDVLARVRIVAKETVAAGSMRLRQFVAVKQKLNSFFGFFSTGYGRGSAYGSSGASGSDTGNAFGDDELVKGSRVLGQLPNIAGKKMIVPGGNRGRRADRDGSETGIIYVRVVSTVSCSGVLCYSHGAIFLSCSVLSTVPIGQTLLCVSSAFSPNVCRFH